MLFTQDVAPRDGANGDARKAGGFLSMVVLLNTMSDEQTLFNAYPADGTGKIRLMSRVRKLAEIENEVKRYKANVVLIDSEMVRDEASVKALGTIIHSMRHNAEYPIIAVGVCYDALWADTFRRLGAFITINGPITPVAFMKRILTGLTAISLVALSAAAQRSWRHDCRLS